MSEQIREVRYNPEEAGKLLLSLIGSWEGTNSTWFKPNELADTSPIRATIRQLPGSNFVIYEYQSSMQGADFQGVALIGFNVLKSQFEMAWGDAFHQSGHILVSTGPGIERGFTVTGKYTYDAEQPALDWRTQFERIDENHLTVTMFNNYPPGNEYKGVEAVYRRAEG